MGFRICLRGLPHRVLGISLCLWSLGVLSSPGSRAQVTGPEGIPLAGPNYIVPPELGKTRGSNLFHSFLEFNIATGESITYTGPDTIANIISLITGGQPSHIDGTIRSEITDANLFLLNPNGVVFGANAQLDVNGSFHVSTADGVRFADDAIYTGNLGDESSLTVAPPVAFGFMRESPSLVQSIRIEGSSLTVPPGQTLSVVGGDITMAGGSLLASGGHLNLISMGDASQVNVPLDTNTLSPDLLEALGGGGGNAGRIELSSGAALSTNGDGGGRIVIRGGHLTVDDSRISSSNNGSMDSPGAGIDIDVTGTVQLLNGSVVFSSVAQGATRRGGDITVTAHEILIAEGASITTSGTGIEPAGDVRVHAEASVTIRDTEDSDLLAGIFSFAAFESSAGEIYVTGGSLVMEGGALGTSPDTETRRNSPRSGSVTIKVDRLMLSHGAQIASSTFSDMPSVSGGTVTITATEVVSLSDGSVITVGTTDRGNAGDIKITAGLLTLAGKSEIASESTGSGTAGTITIAADEIILSASTVTTNAEQTDGGNIVIQSGALRSNHSSITATVNEAEGAGGNITINSELILLESSNIIARASEGRGGNIKIEGRGIVIDAISRIDAASEKGIHGTVEIESVINLSEPATQLSQRFAEPITLFHEPCTERLRGGQVNSFVMLGRDGAPADPSGGLPSLMVDLPLGRWDTIGTADLEERRQAPPARTWRQASLAYDCRRKRSGTAVP